VDRKPKKRSKDGKGTLTIAQIRYVTGQREKPWISQFSRG
jgi:hypothetical protein